MSKEISGCQLSEFCDRDCTAVETKWAFGEVVFASVYIPSECEEVPNRKLIELQSFSEGSNIPLIVGADCIAHSQLWGSSDTNERGENLMDFIMGSNLDVINQGHKPTFVIANRQEELWYRLTCWIGSHIGVLRMKSRIRITDT